MIYEIGWRTTKLKLLMNVLARHPEFSLARMVGVMCPDWIRRVA